MRATLERLLSQSHSAFEVLISVGHDDPDTVAIAERLADETPGQVRVSVDHSPVKNKPRQLNTALRICRNDIVGVFDAESDRGAEPAPQHRQQLPVDRSGCRSGRCAAHQLSRHAGSHCATASSTSSGSARGCTSTRSSASSRSAATRSSCDGTLLEDVGGWDENCLAEDCELGVRLSTLRHRIVVAYSPELVTREETPETVRALVKQRTRWSLGFMQVYAKGLWKTLPDLPRTCDGVVDAHPAAPHGADRPRDPAFDRPRDLGQVPARRHHDHVPARSSRRSRRWRSRRACSVSSAETTVSRSGRATTLVLVLSTPFYQLLLAFSALRAYAKFRTRRLPLGEDGALRQPPRLPRGGGIVMTVIETRIHRARVRDGSRKRRSRRRAVPRPRADMVPASPTTSTMLIVFAAALVIGAWNVNGAPMYQDDEGTYVAQAVAVQNGGLAPYTYWYDHPPFGLDPARGPRLDPAGPRARRRARISPRCGTCPPSCSPSPRPWSSWSHAGCSSAGRSPSSRPRSSSARRCR